MVHRGGGRAGSTNSYTVVTGDRVIHSPGQNVTPDKLSGGDPGGRPPRTQPCQGTPDIAVSPDPPKNHQGTAASACEVQTAGDSCPQLRRGGGRGVLRAARRTEPAMAAYRGPAQATCTRGHSGARGWLDSGWPGHPRRSQQRWDQEPGRRARGPARPSRAATTARQPTAAVVRQMRRAHPDAGLRRRLTTPVPELQGPLRSSWQVRWRTRHRSVTAWNRSSQQTRRTRLLVTRAVEAYLSPFARDGLRTAGRRRAAMFLTSADMRTVVVSERLRGVGLWWDSCTTTTAPLAVPARAAPPALATTMLSLSATQSANAFGLTGGHSRVAHHRHAGQWLERPSDSSARPRETLAGRRPRRHEAPGTPCLSCRSPDETRLCAAPSFTPAPPRSSGRGCRAWPGYGDARQSDPAGERPPGPGPPTIEVSAFHG